MSFASDSGVPMAAAEFAKSWSMIGAVVNLDARLPDWPFIGGAGHVVVGQYERLLADEFAAVLSALAAAHGDRDVALAVAEPAPSYYVRHYDFHPGFRLVTGALADEYWKCLAFEPMGDPTGAIAFTANVVAVVGTNGEWAVWGQRDWDLVIVHTSAPRGPWLDAGVSFVPAAQALEDFTDADRVNDPLSPSDRARFLANAGG